MQAVMEPVKMLQRMQKPPANFQCKKMKAFMYTQETLSSINLFKSKFRKSKQKKQRTFCLICCWSGTIVEPWQRNRDLNSHFTEDVQLDCVCNDFGFRGGGNQDQIFLTCKLFI